MSLDCTKLRANKSLHLNKNALSVFVQDRNPVKFLGIGSLLAA